MAVLSSNLDVSAARQQLELAFGKIQPYEVVKKIVNGQFPCYLRKANEDQSRWWLRDMGVRSISGVKKNPKNLLYYKNNMLELTALLNKMLLLPEPLSRIPYGSAGSYCAEPSNTCTFIEGGNIRFWSHSGRVGAIVGLFSVALSMMVMEKEGFFTDEVLTAKIERMQKVNMSLPSRLSRACAKTQNDVRSDGQIIKEAWMLAAKWTLTEEQIAQDLEIEPKNLIILEHELNSAGHPLLHIDLSVCPGPEKKVFLQNPGLCLDEVKKLNISPNCQSQVFERNRGILMDHGFEVIGVPGYWDLGGTNRAYFLNSLLLGDNNTSFMLVPSINSFIFNALTGPNIQTQRLTQLFYDTVKPHVNHICFVDCGGVIGGALNCLTEEVRKNGCPLGIIPLDCRRLGSVATVVELISNTDLTDLEDVEFTGQFLSGEMIRQPFCRICPKRLRIKIQTPAAIGPVNYKVMAKQRMLLEDCLLPGSHQFHLVTAASS